GPSGATRCTPRPQSRWDVALAVRAADAPRTGGLLLLARDPDGLLLVHDLGSLRRLRAHLVEELDRPAGVRGGPAGAGEHAAVHRDGAAGHPDLHLHRQPP